MRLRRIIREKVGLFNPNLRRTQICFRFFLPHLAPSPTPLFPSKVKYETGFHNMLNVMYEDTPIQNRPTKEQIADQMKWREWIEDRFLHVIAPNLYRNFSDSHYNTKHYVDISEKFAGTWSGTVIVKAGSLAMKFIGGKVHKRYNVSENPREDLYKYCDQWVAALPKSNDPDQVQFMSGTETPGLHDIELFGLISILEGTRVFPDIQENTKIMPWYNKMRNLILSRSGQSQDLQFFIQG